MDECSEFYYNSVESLLTLSIKSVANSIKTDAHSLKYLPTILKHKILRVLTKRGNLTADKLEALLTADVYELDLSESIITDGHLRILGEKCKHLIYLNMNRGRYQNHTFSSEELINTLFHLPCLSTFYADGSTAVNDEVVEKLVEYCPRISALDLGSCPLTDKAAKSIANLRYLESLKISSTKITDQGIFELTDGVCRHTLYELKLNNCDNVTNYSIDSIVEKCPKIKILVFHRCPLITGDCEKVLDNLLSRCNVSHITYTVY